MAFIRLLRLLPLLALLAASVASAQGLRLGDRDPVNFKGKKPKSYPIHGVDVARYNPQIDWRKAKRAGIQFAFIKATEGGDLLDPMLETHWRGARDADIAVGAYHFYYFCTKPEVQARWFIRNVPKGRGAMPPVLDMEWNPQSPTCQRRPPANVVRAEMKVWLDIVERKYRQRPIIYTTPDFYKHAELWKMGSEEFWLRAVAKTPDKIYPGQPWTFWQYSGTGRVPGSTGDTDLNVFVGSASDWAKWRSKRRVRGR